MAWVGGVALLLVSIGRDLPARKEPSEGHPVRVRRIQAAEFYRHSWAEFAWKAGDAVEGADGFVDAFFAGFDAGLKRVRLAGAKP